jgi:hypothetical protein
MPATDLLDRYLNAVKFWLPKAQQQDILAELAEDLRSQIEEREAALGHPLEEADLVAVLKQRGDPMRVASGYIPEHRLIDPSMLPVYRLVLKIVLLWVLAPLFAIVFIAPLFDSARPGTALLQFFTQAWRAGFMVVGMVTVAFALLDRYRAKWIDKWDPRKLPRVPGAQHTTARSNDLAGFIFGIAAFVFWAGVMWQRSEFAFSGGLRIIMAPVWSAIYWPVLGLTLAWALADFFNFLRPARTRVRSWVRLGLDTATVLMAGVLLTVSIWVDFAGPNLSAADAAKAMRWVNGTIQVTLITIAAITLFDAVHQLRLLLRAKSSRPSPILTVS